MLFRSLTTVPGAYSASARYFSAKSAYCAVVAWANIVLNVFVALPILPVPLPMVTMLPIVNVLPVRLAPVLPILRENTPPVIKFPPVMLPVALIRPVVVMLFEIVTLPVNKIFAVTLPVTLMPVLLIVAA